MKTKAFSLFVLCLIYAGCSSSSKTYSAQETATLQAITANVESGDYTLLAAQVLPSWGGTIELTPGEHYVTVRNDSAFIDLPFFGKVHQITAANESPGVKCAGPITNYKMKKVGRDNSYDIRFKVRERSTQHTLRISIGSNGHASFTLITPNKEPVAFVGILKI